MPGTRWLDENQQRAWMGFLHMHGRLTAALHRQLQADSGLSLADYAVLVQLSESTSGQVRPFELCRRLQWEQSRLSHHLRRMQARGLVDREGCGEDGRGALVGLTPAGRAALAGAAPGHVEAVQRLLFDGLSAEQVALLGDLTERVLSRLEPTEPAGPVGPVGAGTAESGVSAESCPDDEPCPVTGPSAPCHVEPDR